MISTVISTSLSIVREREKGTMEQIIVSPIHPMELIIGKTMPYVVISLISTSLILFTGYLLFDVVIRGSIILLFLESLLFYFLRAGTWPVGFFCFRPSGIGVSACYISFDPANIYAVRFCVPNTKYADRDPGDHVY